MLEPQDAEALQARCRRTVEPAFGIIEPAIGPTRFTT
jgi:hypothetical protein